MSFSNDQINRIFCPICFDFVNSGTFILKDDFNILSLVLPESLLVILHYREVSLRLVKFTLPHNALLQTSTEAFRKFTLRVFMKTVRTKLDHEQSFT